MFGKPKKCTRCNLLTKKPIDFCPKCGRKLIPTKDFQYPSDFEVSDENLTKYSPKVLSEQRDRKEDLKQLGAIEKIRQQKIREIEEHNRKIAEEKLKLEIMRKEEEERLIELRKEELEKIKAETKRIKEDKKHAVIRSESNYKKSEEENSIDQKEGKERTSFKPLPLILSASFVLFASLVIFIIPFSYSATEEYVNQEPYEVQVPYTTQEAYLDTEYVSDTVPVNKPSCNFDSKNLANVGSWVGAAVNLISGKDPSQAFNECTTVTDMQQIQKPMQVTKYRDVTRYRSETRYRDVTKTRPCTKRCTVFNQWTGNCKYYFKVGEL